MFVVSIVQCLSGLNVGVVDFSNTNDAILFYPNAIIGSATLQYTLNKPEVMKCANNNMPEKEGKIPQKMGTLFLT